MGDRETETFGRYQLFGVAGSGGMAQVHLARQKGPQGFVKPCVVKRISRGFLEDEEARRMFLEEARISALLNHPHIIQTFDYGDVEGVPYMAMELVDGVNLAQLCRTLADAHRWLSLHSCLEIALSVAEALDYAHNLSDLDGRPLNLIHRDISPQNILLSRQGGVKLIDFGIARHNARDQATIGLQSKGKPGYMSPEQAMAYDLDGRADLFSLGIVLVELISARRVFAPKAYSAGLAGIQKRVHELIGLRNDVAEPLRRLAQAMTQLDPSDRPASARVVAAELRRHVGHLPGDSLSVVLGNAFANLIPLGAVGALEAKRPQGALPVGALEAKRQQGARAVERARSEAPFQDEWKSDEGEPISDTLIDASSPVFQDPPQGGAQSRFDREAWTKGQPKATGASALYEGWPKEIVGDEPGADPDLVARSSSVDAMKYFAAEGSSKAPPPAPSPREARAPRPAQSDPIAFAGKKLSKFFGQAQTGESDAEHDEPDLALTPDAAPAAEKAGAKKKSGRPAYVVVGALGGLIALLGFGVLFAISRVTNRAPPPAPPKTGSILVRSYPAGAAILVDGVDTRQVTPFEVSGLLVDRRTRLSVALPGYLAVPAEVVVSIQDGGPKPTATFTLKRGRVFRLETQPPSATIAFNGTRLADLSPTDLPPIAIGDTATIGLSLDGYMPLSVMLRSLTTTPTISAVKLEVAKVVDIVSEPPGAQIFVDGASIGTTPLYDLMVPGEKGFQVKVERKGYKTWKRQLSARKMRERLIQADLAPLPLLAMPMSNEDRKDAKDLDHKLARVNGELRKIKSELAKAEKRLAAVERQPNIFIGRITDAQHAVDDARTRIDELEAQQQDLEGQVVEFRQRVMSKIDGTAD